MTVTPEELLMRLTARHARLINLLSSNVQLDTATVADAVFGLNQDLIAVVRILKSVKGE